MATKGFSFLAGLGFLFFGISGMFASLVWLPPDRLRFYDIHMIGHWGFLYGWLPVNMVHNVLYVIFGATGVLMAITLTSAIAWSRCMFAIATLLAFVGFLPFGISAVWGLLPLFQWNVMVHSVVAMLAYYYGFIYPLDLGGVAPAE